jgi:hypothetical protein
MADVARGRDSLKRGDEDRVRISASRRLGGVFRIAGDIGAGLAAHDVVWTDLRERAPCDGAPVCARDSE